MHFLHQFFKRLVDFLFSLIEIHFITFCFLTIPLFAFQLHSPNSMACSTDSTGSLLSTDDYETAAGEYYMIAPHNNRESGAHLPSQPPISETEEMDYLTIEPAANQAQRTHDQLFTDGSVSALHRPRGSGTSNLSSFAIASDISSRFPNKASANLNNNFINQSSKDVATGNNSFAKELSRLPNSLRLNSTNASDSIDEYMQMEFSASTDTLTPARLDTSKPSSEHDYVAIQPSSIANSDVHAVPTAELQRHSTRTISSQASAMETQETEEVGRDQHDDEDEYLMVEPGNESNKSKYDSDHNLANDYLEVDSRSKVPGSSNSVMASSPCDSNSSSGGDMGQLLYTSGPFAPIQRSKFKLEKVRSFFSPGEQQESSDFIKPVRTYSIGSRAQLNKSNTASNALSNSSLQGCCSFKPHHQLTGHKTGNYFSLCSSPFTFADFVWFWWKTCKFIN